MNETSNGEPFACAATRVWDGDGPIWCASGEKVRLSGIAAREADGSCRPGHPCPDASAEAARAALVAAIGAPVIGRSAEGHVLLGQGPPLACTRAGASKGRVVAWCVTASGVDLSCAMVASGTALRWDRYWRGHRCP